MNRKEVFQPEAWFKYIVKAENGLVSVGRQNAIIHYPLKSLRDVCQWKLLFLVQSREDIFNLELPKTVKADLLHIFNNSTRFIESDENSDASM